MVLDSGMMRRRFLEAGLPVLGMHAGGRRLSAAADKVVIGIMGIGGRGTQLTQWFSERPDIEVAYVCEARQDRLERAAALVKRIKGKSPREVRDFRRMLDDKSVDAVVNATPEHWHGVSTILACQAGKDVYVEKAASFCIWEGQKMVEAARKYKRVVQVGMQTRSAPYTPTAAALLRSGKLGKVHLVRVNNELGGRKLLKRGPDQPVPQGLDWEMWVGPAPLRPYNPIYFSRLLWDYDGGSLTGDTVHQLDLARCVIGKGFPKSVHHSGAKHVFASDDSEQPDTRIITYEYDDLTLVVEHTEATPYMTKIPLEVRDGERLPDWYPFIGTKVEIFGTEGFMILGRVGGGWQAYGPKGEEGPWEKSRHIDMQVGHIADFVNCVRTRERPKGDIEEGHISAALCHMGNISYRVGNRKLEFDAVAGNFANDSEANRLLRRTYRAPWVIPDKV